MKLSTACILFSMLGASSAFIVPPAARLHHHQVMMHRTASSTSSPASQLYMSSTESDFATAMPDKPNQSMQERMEEAATTFIASFTERLGEGVDPPPELEALRKARDENAPPEIMTARIYELMCEQSMLYDVDPQTGIMTPTEWVITENLEEDNVKQEFKMLYNYGMNLVFRGMIGVEELKEIVKKRLIARTGKTPEEFDAWLGF